MSDIRPAAVAGRFYPSRPDELRALVDGFLRDVDAAPTAARAAIAPHAGLVYSGACAAQVFARIDVPPVIVILGPNHTGVFPREGMASVWTTGAFETPLGLSKIDEAFAAALLEASAQCVPDVSAHRDEHAIEVELPFVATLAPDSSIVPIIVHSDEWAPCKRLAADLARVITSWPDRVLIVASSDMTHFESAASAARKDEVAFDAIRALDGAGLLEACHRERITMCGRAPSAIALEGAKLLGAEEAEVVDYRHSGWVTGDDADVVAYAGVIVR